MELSQEQKRAVDLCALAEMRSPEQMLSLLLEEGIRFYFADREPIHGWKMRDFDDAKLVEEMHENALAIVSQTNNQFQANV
jgi:hypothetical protein